MRWSVTLQATGDRVLTREEVVALADAVAANDGIASGIGTMHYGAQVVVEAADRAAAAEQAAALFSRAAERAELPLWPISRVEAISEADDDPDGYG